MTLTRLDLDLSLTPSCYEFGGRYVALSRPELPGSLFLALATASEKRLGGQVAARVATAEFAEKVCELDLKALFSRKQDFGSWVRTELLRIISETNKALYGFGHQLLAGGRMGTGFLGLMRFGEELAVVRIGEPVGYLVRNGSLVPFFEPQKDSSPVLGTNSEVEVQVTTVHLRAHDLALLLLAPLDTGEEVLLAKTVTRSRVPDTQEIMSAFEKNRGENGCAMIELGPDTYFLDKVREAL